MSSQVNKTKNNGNYDTSRFFYIKDKGFSINLTQYFTFTLFVNNKGYSILPTYAFVRLKTR